MVPFSFFVIVPLAELLLPIALKLFPNMLPSHFQSQAKKQEQLKRELRLRLNVADFMQDVVKDIAKRRVETDDKAVRASAEKLLHLVKNVRQGHRVQTDELVSVASLFKDVEINAFERPTLVQICRYMNINTMGSDNMLRFLIQSKLNRLEREDLLLVREGINNLEEEELRSICRARGMRDFGLTYQGYVRNVQQWLDLSIHKRVPRSLLVLSRALNISEKPSGEEVRAVLSGLQEDDSWSEFVQKAGVEMDNETRLAIVKRQNELIVKEEEDEKKKEKQANETQQEAERPAPSPSQDVLNVFKAKKDTAKESKEDQDGLQAIVENLLSMTQVSSVERERKRLNELLMKVSESERDERQLEIVKKMRPSINLQKKENEEPNHSHPIQTLDQLAKWHRGRVGESDSEVQLDKNVRYNDAKDIRRLISLSIDDPNKRETINPKEEDALKDRAEAGEETLEDQASKAEAEKVETARKEAYQARIRKRLNTTLEKLKARISEIDQELGTHAPEIQLDAAGRISDAELQRALRRLVEADLSKAQEMAEKIKQLAKKRRTLDGEVDGPDEPVPLTVEDVEQVLEMVAKQRDDSFASSDEEETRNDKFVPCSEKETEHK